MFTAKTCTVDDVSSSFAKKSFNIYSNWNMLLDKSIRYKTILNENLFRHLSWLSDMFSQLNEISWKWSRWFTNRGSLASSYGKSVSECHELSGDEVMYMRFVSDDRLHMYLEKKTCKKTPLRLLLKNIAPKKIVMKNKPLWWLTL